MNLSDPEVLSALVRREMVICLRPESIPGKS